MMNLEIELYEALVDAGVSKDKARDVVLAQKDSMDQILTTLATKADLQATKADLQCSLTEIRTYVDGRFNLVDGRFNLIGEQMASMTNRIVIRLGALMVVLTGLLGTALTLMRR
jgi:hypothetical protein